MYAPAHFEETDVGRMHALMRAHPLGALVSAGADGLAADHLPWLVDPEPGPFGTLRGHVARANPVWRSLDGAHESLVVFQGPAGYVSPSWYPSKHEHGKAVPTWNYAAVHAYGAARAIEDADWLLDFVNALTDRHESTQALPWKVSDAPEDFVAKMIGAIVGIEIPVARLHGKWKVSQNRPRADREGVAAGLAGRGGETAAALAELVRPGAPD